MSCTRSITSVCTEGKTQTYRRRITEHPCDYECYFLFLSLKYIFHNVCDVQGTHPCRFVQAGAGNSDVGHGHVIDWLLCFGDTSLLLQAVQHHQRTHDPAAKLKTRIKPCDSFSQLLVNVSILVLKTREILDLLAVLESGRGEASEDKQRLVLLVHLQNSILGDAFQVFFRLKLKNRL